MLKKVENGNISIPLYGQLSPSIQNRTGVNQGGISSGLMFRKYLADLGEYLNNQHVIVISDEILVHLLWADDLILFSDTCEGMQNILNGLEKFSSNNQIVVNEKKMLCFGKQLHPMYISTTSLLKRMTIMNILAMWYGPSVYVIKIYFPETLHICAINLERHYLIYVKRLNVLAPYRQRLCFICLMHWYALF